ncbi:uncharacterized protein LOC117807471 [Notolabrus celidotus]|uniref:uncharacterized protein LOC117807471 n=1 Tax=Notolabrus celidotus TaxID=1203425 RepID=UPI00148F8E2E|nr:uncharacterized protein LOC117807471 [Notolabrus celidotus]
MMHLFTILCGVFHLSAVVRSAAVEQDTGVISVTAGDNVTLKCFYDSQVAMHFSWYRQILGGGPELLSTIYKYDKPTKVSPWMEKNPRFSLQRMERTNHLLISDVQFSDSASYFCGSSHSNIVEFGDGVFLSVEAHLSAVVRSAAVEQDTGVISVTAGDNVTLKCFYDSEVAMHFSWYRQILGGGPELLSTIYKYDKPTKVSPWMEKNPRFSLQRMERTNHLLISDVQFSDSASYFCGSSHSNIVEFGDGVFLSVEGANLKEIDQRPAFKMVQPGSSVTLNCTVHTGSCDDKHSVYWFRQGSLKGILHTQGDRRKQVSTPGSPSQSCVYHLQKVNLSSSDTGTYYCAVASCGDILFGNGSKLLITDGAEEELRILVWLSIIRTGILLLFVTICLLVFLNKNRKKS